jgi:acyl dehydratase
MTNNVDDLVTDEMRACIGTTTPVYDLPEEIGASDVRRFLDVIGDVNPLYRDEAYARHFGYDGRVVPPILVVQLYRRVGGGEGSEEHEWTHWPGLTLPPGYTNSRNAGHEFEWLRPVYVGDRLTLQRRLADIFVRTGRTGVPVIYIVSETEIRNQAGEPVLRQTSTTAKLPQRSVAEAR